MIHSMGKIDYAQEGECKKSIATVRRYSRILFLLVVMSSVVSFVTFVSLDRAFVISSMNLFFQLSPQNEDRYLQHEHVWSDNVVSNKNRMSSELTVVVPKNYHSSGHRISSYSNLTHEHEATASRRLILSQATKLSSSAAKTTTIFYATGDVPYSTDQASKLKQQLLNIPSDAEFIIHVGDIRNANGKRSICRQEEYTNVASLLRLSPVPVFILLGDNDWNDCSNPSSALKFWQKEFLLFDKRYWKNHTFPVRRQMKREENFSFINKGTLFIGLNIVGGAIINHTEWTRRLEEEFNWCKFLIQFYTNTTVPFPSIGRVVIFGHADPTRNHNSFFVPLRTFIQNELKNRVPILYIHGDRHRWLYEPNYLNQSSMLRISLQGLASEVPLKVSVHATGKSSATNEAFTYERRSYRYTHKKVKRPIKINH